MEKAIIGVTGALIIFTLTQIFIHLRDRQTILRGKLEDLFSALNEISSRVLDTYYGAQSFEKMESVRN